MKASKTGIITVHEDFMQVETRTIDTKNRVSLGNKIKKLLMGKMKVEAFKVFVGRHGDLLLRPSVSIPSREAWLFENPSALAKLKQGFSEAQEGKTHKVKDLDAFFNSL